MKKALGFFAAMAVGVSLMCASAYAATISAGTQASKPGETVTVPVTIAPDEGDSSVTVNGYVVELTYDPNVLTPIQQGVDETNSACYASTTLTGGVLVADLKDTDGNNVKDTVAIGWAAADFVTVAEETQLAAVNFAVSSTTAEKSTTIGIKVVTAASDASTLTTYTVADGNITLGSDILRGDANGDGSVTGADATLISRYVVNLETIESKNEAAADANSDGSITGADATVISRYIVSLEQIQQ